MFSRRSLLVAVLALFGLGVDEALAARRRRRQAARRPARQQPTRRAAPAVAATPVKPVTPKPMLGRALPVPPLVLLGPDAPFTLSARATEHAALPGRMAPTLGFGGAFRGPALVIRRGQAATLRIENATGRALDWSVATAADVGVLSVAPGALAETRLRIDTPASLHLYHARAVTNVEAIEGGFGPLIVVDPDAATLALPSRWGLDDFPVVLDDATFDEDGRPVVGVDLGARLLANGITDAIITVPKALVRLRLYNAARARVFRLYFEDETPFHLIATDGGFLPAPVSLDILRLAPGERAEVLIDCTQGFQTRLMTTPDNRERRLPRALVDVEDQSQALSQVLGIDPQYDADGVMVLPAALALPRAAQPGPDAPRRLLAFGARAAASAGVQVSDAGLGVETWTVAPGVVEVWRLEAVEQAETIRVEGARITVLAEADGPPQPWNRGPKDTVFVDRTMEIAVVFDRPRADGAAHRVLRVVGRGIDGAEVAWRIVVTG